MNGDVETLRPESFGQGQPGPARQFDVKHARATIAIKMAMLAHIRAKMRRAPIQRDLPHQAALYQRIQTVIDRGHRDVRHPALGPDEHFLGSRMIALLQQHVINLLPLAREESVMASCHCSSAWRSEPVGTPS